MGRKLRPLPQFNHVSSYRCRTELNRKFWAELLFHIPRAETSVLRGGDSAPRNIFWGTKGGSSGLASSATVGISTAHI